MTTGFLDEEIGTPHAFIQWKGTNVCMDFNCSCGAHCHFDGDFAYAVKCPHCGTVWEMPCIMVPRQAAVTTYPGDSAKMLEADEDYCDADGNALPITSEDSAPKP